MNLIKYNYNPFAPLRSFEKVFDDFFSLNGGEALRQSPSVNVVETGDGFRIEVAAPGLEKKDFEINLDHGTLSISANREERHEEEKPGRFTRKEFNYTSFKRNFSLPDNVNLNEISAKYENGILTVTLPKFEVEKPEETVAIEVK